MDAVQADYGLDPTPGDLVFGLSWGSSTGEGSGVSLTTGSLEIRVADQVVWAADSGFQWAWIELLEWLGLSWIRLNFEDGLPFKADPPTADDLVKHMERESKYSPEGAASELEIQFWEFLESHDLSRALEGAMLPSIIVWREGNVGHLLTDDSHVRCEWAGLRDNLKQLGDSVAERAGQAVSDRRVERALRRWANRDEATFDEVASVASGLQADRLAPVLDVLSMRNAEANELERPDELVKDELLAAARMTSALSTDLIMDVMGHLVSLGKGSSALIDEVAATLSNARRTASARPFEQGHALGAALREQFGLGPADRFDPIEWLRSHDVEYRTIALQTTAIDALASWGRNTGPAVLVNIKGAHSQSPRARNATIAHEICHLLVDRTGALPAAEVMGGRVNPAVEARANAFAAELLLPRERAGTVLSGANDARAARRLVGVLTRSHKVSQEIVAWQARNSDAALPSSVMEYLRKLVATPWRF